MYGSFMAGVGLFYTYLRYVLALRPRNILVITSESSLGISATDCSAASNTAIGTW